MPTKYAFCLIKVSLRNCQFLLKVDQFKLYYCVSCFTLLVVDIVNCCESGMNFQMIKSANLTYVIVPHLLI